MSFFSKLMRGESRAPYSLSLKDIDKKRADFNEDSKKALETQIDLRHSLPKARARAENQQRQENVIADKAFKTRFGSFRDAQLNKAGLGSTLIEQISTKLTGDGGTSLTLTRALDGDNDPPWKAETGGLTAAELPNLQTYLDPINQETNINEHEYQKLETHLKQKNLAINLNNAEPSLNFIVGLLQHASGEYQTSDMNPHLADARELLAKIALPQDNGNIGTKLDDKYMCQALELVQEKYNDLAITVNIMAPVKDVINNDSKKGAKLKLVTSVISKNETPIDGKVPRQLTVTLLKHGNRFSPITDKGNLFSPERHPEARRAAKKSFVRRYTANFKNYFNPERARVRALTDHLLKEEFDRTKTNSGVNNPKLVIREYLKRSSTDKINEVGDSFLGLFDQRKRKHEKEYVETLKKLGLEGLEIRSNGEITKRERRLISLAKSQIDFEALKNKGLAQLKFEIRDIEKSKKERKLIAEAKLQLEIALPKTCKVAVPMPLASKVCQENVNTWLRDLKRDFSNRECTNKTERIERLDTVIGLVDQCFLRSDKAVLKDAKDKLQKIADDADNLSLNKKEKRDLENILESISEIETPSSEIPTSDPLMKEYQTQIFEEYASSNKDPGTLRAIERYKQFKIDDQKNNLSRHLEEVNNLIKEVDRLPDSETLDAAKQRVETLKRRLTDIGKDNSIPNFPVEACHTLLKEVENIEKFVDDGLRAQQIIKNYEDFKASAVPEHRNDILKGVIIQEDDLSKIAINTFLRDFEGYNLPTVKSSIPDNLTDDKRAEIERVRQKIYD
jgi:hypothetical protein